MADRRSPPPPDPGGGTPDRGGRRSVRDNPRVTPIFCTCGRLAILSGCRPYCPECRRVVTPEGK